MRVDYLFAGVTVHEINAAIRWYTAVLGGEPDMRPHSGEATWRLTETASLFVREVAGRAGGGVVTIIVDDLDAEVRRLRDTGVDVDGPQRVGDAGRKATLVDPDGNRIEVVALS